MPIEWNILMIYGGIFLFGFHPEATVLAAGSMPLLLAFVLFCMFAVPLYGNFVPSRVSFLLAMRYYAGNWAYNIWLIRKDGLDKLAELTKNAETTRVQLGRVLPDPKWSTSCSRHRSRTDSCTWRAARCSRRCRARWIGSTTTSGSTARCSRA